MLNHVRRGLERTYDQYQLEDEKRVRFLRWEAEIASIAQSLGRTLSLNVPKAAFSPEGEPKKR